MGTQWIAWSESASARQVVTYAVGSAAVVAVAACGGLDLGAPRPSASPTPSLAAGVAPLPTTGPAAPTHALKRAGMRLPHNAVGARAERMDVSEVAGSEGYRVRFTVPRANALQICQSANLGGDLPVVKFTSTDRQLLGPDLPKADESRICANRWADNTAWQRTAVVGPGNPARVDIAVARMVR